MIEAFFFVDRDVANIISLGMYLDLHCIRLHYLNRYIKSIYLLISYEFSHLKRL